jgi:hypothetical protein
MWRVACNARQPAATPGETFALAQEQWLMARVPRIIPVGGIARGGRLAMASAAQLVQLNRG